MGEIKFDATRMKEVVGRLDEITSQLKSSAATNNSSIQSIEGNITGDAVLTVLKGYREKNEEVVKETENLIQQLTEYLNTQLSSYTTNEQTATETITDVQSILSGLEG